MGLRSPSWWRRTRSGWARGRVERRSPSGWPSRYRRRYGAGSRCFPRRTIPSSPAVASAARSRRGIATAAAGSSQLRRARRALLPGNVRPAAVPAGRPVARDQSAAPGRRPGGVVGWPERCCRGPRLGGRPARAPMRPPVPPPWPAPAAVLALFDTAWLIPPMLNCDRGWALQLSQEQIEQHGAHDRGDKREQDHQQASWPAAKWSDLHSSRPHGLAPASWR
jgi:hypothetical protein